MKKVILSAVVVLFMGATSCSKADEPTSSSTELNKSSADSESNETASEAV